VLSQAKAPALSPHTTGDTGAIMPAPPGQLRPLSKLQRFLWPEGHLNDDAAPWASQPSRTVLWWTLVAFAALDMAYPLSALTGEWWCAFVVLWVIPWRRPVCAGSPQTQAVAWLSSLVLFSWLIYRTQTAAAEAVSTWFVFRSSPRLKLLSFPMQATCAAVVTATLTVIPLRKILGERATTVAMLASLPYALHFGVDTIFVPARWTTHTLANAILLYSAVTPALVIAEGSSLLARFPIIAVASPMDRSLRVLTLRLLTGRLNAGVALSVLYAGALIGAVWAMRLWIADNQTPLRSPGELAMYSVAFPGAVFILALAAIATWRSLARAGRPLAIAGRLFVVTTAGPLAAVALLFAAPRSGHALSEAVQLLPGPAWSIKPAPMPGGLRLSGEFQHGVSDDLANVLARNPSIRRLELDSPGGYMSEGLAAAALVTKYSLSTSVRHRCASACALVFISGRERVLAPGAKLGFHRARGFFWDDAFDDHRSNVRLIDFVRSKGVKEDFARKAFAIPNADIWYPSVDELLASGVVTTVAR
jgi:hypothetical protein